MTYKEFVEQNCATDEVEELALLLNKAYLGAEAHELSLLSVLWYIKQCKGTKRFFSGICFHLAHFVVVTELTYIRSGQNGAQERKFIGGSQQISERIADYIGNERVLLNKPVSLIKQSDESIEVRTLDGSAYSCRHLIVAMSPAMQAKFHWEPPLPPARNHLLQRFPMGCVIKTIGMRSRHAHQANVRVV